MIVATIKAVSHVPALKIELIYLLKINLVLVQPVIFRKNSKMNVPSAIILAKHALMTLHAKIATNLQPKTQKDSALVKIVITLKIILMNVLLVTQLAPNAQEQVLKDVHPVQQKEHLQR